MIDSSDRPHRSASTNNTNSNSNSSSELFICFTSRLSSSSSSMKKISSKSSSSTILSPAHHHHQPLTLSTSLSRRLRTNGSLRAGAGQASPMFPTGNKRRGCAFDNPEPSSPKVTCIGQVRVKTKKQGKKIRTLSRRRCGGVDGSFRKPELSREGSCHGYNQQPVDCSAVQHRNQRWVHLPLTICEALRSEFSCLFPCRPSCFSTERREKTAAAAEAGQSSCGSVFARWLVALQDGEEEEERRVVMDDEKWKVKDGEEGGRVSICVPPKNALLLMRCRSDPIKVSALANRLWESPVTIDDDEDEDEEEEDDDQERHDVNVNEKVQVINVEEDKEESKVSSHDLKMEERDSNDAGAFVEEDNQETEIKLPMAVVQVDHTEVEVEEFVICCDSEEEEEELEINEEWEDLEESEIEDEFCLVSLFKEKKLQSEEYEADLLTQEEEEDDLRSNSHSGDSVDSTILSELEDLARELAALVEEEAEKSIQDPYSQPEEVPEEEEDNDGGGGGGEEEEENLQCSEGRGRRSMALPESLMLMMCEPKLSMEVSKETWVCSTDFIRRPSLQVIATDGPDRRHHHEPEKRTSTTGSSNPCLRPPPLQPPRSSFSFPAPPVSMAAMIEQKLVSSVAYEPFVLTRCKSAPMRTAAKLAPEPCCWKEGKLEPHRRTTFGIGAAGLGF